MAAMKLLIVILLLAGGYFYLLTHTTDIVLGQTQQLSAQYQSAAAFTDRLSAGR